MEAAFQIINAAAGSGKTFTLVRQYLKQLLSLPDPYAFESFLALTFTNKAVHEMKERLLFYLHQLSLEKPKETAMRDYLIDDTGLTAQQIQKKSVVLLGYILHHYSRFDVITLDGFTHRIIRTFAADLKLPPQFELVLDSNSFLDELVDDLIQNIGADSQLTKILLEFSQLKLEEGKSGSIELDLKSFAKVLVRENDLQAFRALMDMPREQVEADLKALKALRKNSKTRILETAETLEDYFKSFGLETEDFYRGEPYKTLLKIKQGSFNGFGKTIQKQRLGELPFVKEKNSYNKNIAQETFQPHVAEELGLIEKYGLNMRLSSRILQSIVPMMLLQQMEVRFQQKQQKEQKLVLARLNALIAKIVAEQPTPYIYERLGVRYRHFFLDEFQDTSALQWYNLTPLIDNSLSSQEESQAPASVFLVGDPKQAIYRWRGGHVDQYLKLLGQDQFGFSTLETSNLQSNFRSQQTIVDFNNTLFSYLSKHLKEASFKEIYQQTVRQEVIHKAEGYVQVDRYEKLKDKSENDQQILEWTKSVLDLLAEKKTALGDVAILVRNNSQAQQLGEFLTDHAIRVQSAESLILGKNPIALGLKALLEWTLDPKNKSAQLQFLEQLWNLNHREKISYHNFVAPLVEGKSLAQGFLALRSLWGYNFEMSYFEKAALYEAVIYAAEIFFPQLTQESGMLVFLQEIHQFTQKNQASKLAFIDYWQEQADRIYIPGEKSNDAVQIMTFHKAKGLQFSAVILPYLDEKINHSKDRVWYPIPDSISLQLPFSWMSLNSKLSELGEIGAALWEQHERESQFDALNLFYVGCTRAEQALFLYVPSIQGDPHENTAFGINAFLDQCTADTQQQEQWSWGKLALQSPKKESRQELETTAFRISHEWRSKLLVAPLDIGAPSDAQNYGVLVHDLMGKIKDLTDVDAVLEEAQEQFQWDADMYKLLQKQLSDIVEHPQLAPYFDPVDQGLVYNEKDILMPDGTQIRPDRLQETPSGWVLMDYKTGDKSRSHLLQMETYAEAITSMGISLKHRILIYCSPNIEVIWV